MEAVKIDYQAIATIVVTAVVVGVMVMKAIDKVFDFIDRRRKKNGNGRSGNNGNPGSTVKVDRILKAVHDSEDVPISANIRYLKLSTDKMISTLNDVSKSAERTTQIQERILDKLDKR